MIISKTVAIYVFDEIEVLDLGGPFEVFSVANRLAAKDGRDQPFNVVTVSSGADIVQARGGYRFCPSHNFANVPPADVLVVPGGVVDHECARPDVIAWLRQAHDGAELTASVCTGAFLLAEAGVLTGLEVTTHWEDIDELERRYPDLHVLRDRLWVDEGRVVTSGGISAGIDMSLHLVRRLEGLDLARRVARQMEYDWRSLSGIAEQTGVNR
ncbi:DJ-1/PfpI family protein [Magnetovibrio sp.]|uniref:DJ-1/PfpI family protein n=1 Tax=Magnetovibrio sp. TaxID=2024836 RepID=UPI002F929EA1